jgi:AMMECR1 domain-containing protein
MSELPRDGPELTHIVFVYISEQKRERYELRGTCGCAQKTLYRKFSSSL